MEKLIEFFCSSNLISTIKAKEISGHFEEKTILKNEYHLKEDRICNEYLFLESGFMRAFTYDINGNDITTAFYSKGRVSI